MDKSPTNIIYIVSSAHSGSTLLDLILGSHSAIQSGGEFYRLPKNFDNKEDGVYHSCTCGQKVTDCDFWTRVVDGANIDFNEIQSNRDFFSLYEKIIPSMLNVAGKTFFVDSSKRLPIIKKYLNSDQFQVSIIHLVRDPRAVAYSFLRKRRRMIINKDSNSPENIPPKFIQSLWLILRGNLRYILGLSKHKLFHTIKYEDYVVNPNQALGEFLARINLPFEDGIAQYYNYTHHIIGGNPMRFQKKPIAPDQEYKQGLSAFEWLVSTCITLPMILKYKYPLFRRT